MDKEELTKQSSVVKMMAPHGKPVKVLSTTLGIALLANAASAAQAAAVNPSHAAAEPKLVSWSTEEVKSYFDKQVDWSLPLSVSDEEEQEAGNEGIPVPGGGSGGTTVIHQSGFGWDDLLLYHLLFNRGSVYSSTDYYSKRGGYYAGTGTPYKPNHYSSDTFQNKRVAGSVVPPKTSNSKGAIIRRSTSASPGSIGGRSSGLSSSSSSSNSSKSSSSTSSGFGG